MASTLTSAFGSSVQEIRLKNRLSGLQIFAPTNSLLSSACDEDGNEAFIAVDLLFQQQREIDETEFERHRSVVLLPTGAEHMNQLARRTLKNGQFLAFERRHWTTDTILAQYDLAEGRRRVVLTETEVAEAIGTEFLAAFIDDERLLVLHRNRMIVGRLNGKKVEVLHSKDIDTSGIEVQQISWKNNSIHIIYNTPNDSGSTISRIPIRRPTSLLMAAHNSALSSNQQFLLPLYGLPEPEFGNHPYRIH